MADTRSEAPATGSAPADDIRFRGPRLVNRLFYRTIDFLLRRPILAWFQLKPVNAGVVPRTGAGIVLGNHTALFDPIWLYAMLRRPVYFAASEDLFRQPALARVIRWFGAFPKRKNASGDVGAMRSIFHLLKTGCLVGIYPEGVRTWDGTNGPIIPGIARLIRKLRVPVYTCRTEGGYLAQPRWARRYRRIPMQGVFTRLYDDDAIPADDGQIVSDIAAAIHNADYTMTVDPALDRRKGLAVNITRVLYRCPSCGTFEGLKIVQPLSTNRVECASCFTSWVVSAASRLAETDENGEREGDWATLAELYARIRAMPLAPIRPVSRLRLAEGERLYLASRPRFLFKQEQFPNIRVLAFGRAFLTDRRLIFRTRLGTPLDAPLGVARRAVGRPRRQDALHARGENLPHPVPQRERDEMVRRHLPAPGGRRRRGGRGMSGAFLRLAAMRSSVRRYLADRPVGDADIAAILEAARLAPSAENAQPWRFVIVRDPALRLRLVEEAFSGIYRRSRRIDAPVFLALCGVHGAVDLAGQGGRPLLVHAHRLRYRGRARGARRRRPRARHLLDRDVRPAPGAPRAGDPRRGEPDRTDRPGVARRSRAGGPAREGAQAPVGYRVVRPMGRAVRRGSVRERVGDGE